MKKTISILLILLTHTLYAKDNQLELNFVLFGEVNMQNCYEQERVLFQSQIIYKSIDDYSQKRPYIENVKQNFKVYLKELVQKQYPQYYLKNCIPDVSKWLFFEESSIDNPGKLRQIIFNNYSDVKIIQTDFNFTPEPKKAKPEIDPQQSIINAYYKQALKMYKNQDYPKSISTLKKAKAILDGQVNLDIMLLEAKARFANDKNINQSKKLLQNFIKQAAKANDQRVDEAAELIVEIEISEKFHKTGYRKLIESELKSGKDIILNKDYFREDGSLLKTTQINKSWGNKLFKEVDYSSLKGKIVIDYNRDQTIKTVKYYLNNKLYLVVADLESTINHFRKNKLAQHVKLNDNKTVNCTIYKSYESKNDNFVLTKLNNAEVLETYSPNIDKIQRHEDIKMLGMIKKAKVVNEKEDYNIYIFNEYGMPTKKLYYNKRDKLKDEYRFNMASSTWKEL